jgi:hypothetical protein
MKKIIPVCVVLVLILSACDILGGAATETPMSDAQMATRVAELLSTMTTPTTEIVFPPTSTPTEMVTETPTSEPTATPQVEYTEIITATPGLTTTVEATSEATAAGTQATEATATPTATATLSSNDPAVYLGTPTGTDPMDNATLWQWPTGEDEYLSVTFSNSKMHMTGLTTLAGWRLPLISQQTDTYIELTANSGTCTGKDSYGIIFRVPVLKAPTQGYLFEVTCDGYYRLWKWDGEAGTKGVATALVPWNSSTLITAGANQTNRLGVMVKDDTFTLYMNGEELASATDSAFSAGFFGVFVRSAESADYTVKFDQMRYWENPK